MCQITFRLSVCIPFRKLSFCYYHKYVWHKNTLTETYKQTETKQPNHTHTHTRLRKYPYTNLKTGKHEHANTPMKVMLRLSLSHWSNGENKLTEDEMQDKVCITIRGKSCCRRRLSLCWYLVSDCLAVWYLIFMSERGERGREGGWGRERKRGREKDAERRTQVDRPEKQIDRQVDGQANRQIDRQIKGKGVGEEVGRERMG